MHGDMARARFELLFQAASRQCRSAVIGMVHVQALPGTYVPTAKLHVMHVDTPAQNQRIYFVFDAIGICASRCMNRVNDAVPPSL